MKQLEKMIKKYRDKKDSLLKELRDKVNKYSDTDFHNKYIEMQISKFKLEALEELKAKINFGHDCSKEGCKEYH